MVPDRLAILGVGLLGGSIGLAVKNRIKACEIIGYSHRSDTLKAAMEMGAIDHGCDSAAQAVKQADLVIICTPVLTISRMMTEISSNLMDGAIVTDVGSTKRSIVEDADRILPAHARFVGSHPMAGSEKRGVQFARADLFDNALCIVTPWSKTKSTATADVVEFWMRLGMHIREMSPEAHDRAVAEVSHLPHLVAAALISMQDDSSLQIAGRGFLDMTRIASGDGGLWRDILVDNKAEVRRSIERLRQQLAHVEALLGSADSEALKRWLDDAAVKREQAIDKRK